MPGRGGTRRQRLRSGRSLPHEQPSTAPTPRPDGRAQRAAAASGRGAGARARRDTRPRRAGRRRCAATCTVAAAEARERDDLPQRRCAARPSDQHEQHQRRRPRAADRSRRARAAPRVPRPARRLAAEDAAVVRRRVPERRGSGTRQRAPPRARRARSRGPAARARRRGSTRADPTPRARRRAGFPRREERHREPDPRAAAVTRRARGAAEQQREEREREHRDRRRPRPPAAIPRGRAPTRRAPSPRRLAPQPPGQRRRMPPRPPSTCQPGAPARRRGRRTGRPDGELGAGRDVVPAARGRRGERDRSRQVPVRELLPERHGPEQVGAEHPDRCEQHCPCRDDRHHDPRRRGSAVGQRRSSTEDEPGHAPVPARHVPPAPWVVLQLASAGAGGAGDGPGEHRVRRRGGRRDRSGASCSSTIVCSVQPLPPARRGSDRRHRLSSAGRAGAGNVLRTFACRTSSCRGRGRTDDRRARRARRPQPTRCYGHVRSGPGQGLSPRPGREDAPLPTWRR